MIVVGGRYQRNPRALSRQSLDAVIVLPPGETEPLTLAGTGPELWDLLADPISIDELTRTLAARHRTEEVVVKADVIPMLEHLESVGLIRRAD